MTVCIDDVASLKLIDFADIQEHGAIVILHADGFRNGNLHCSRKKPLILAIGEHTEDEAPGNNNEGIISNKFDKLGHGSTASDKTPTRFDNNLLSEYLVESSNSN